MKEILLGLILVAALPAGSAATECGEDPGEARPVSLNTCAVDVFVADLERLHQGFAYASCRLLEATGDVGKPISEPAEDAGMWSARIADVLEKLTDPAWHEHLAECGEKGPESASSEDAGAAS